MEMIWAISKNYHFVGKTTNSTSRVAALQGSCKYKAAVKFVQFIDPLKTRITLNGISMQENETEGACSMHRRDEK